ncbi:hypothetical protein NDU88_003256 [Pleurodeles waltl]|uniref:Uncharacterized protein n=1 Tax=Pleurodeles waltl TaxID=8319 RepID=A0AAV7PBR2_PLEWA|nr:hypothetical protein NDU88_003256 [Pleurodeles waltl]
MTALREYAWRCKKRQPNIVAGIPLPIRVQGMGCWGGACSHVREVNERLHKEGTNGSRPPYWWYDGTNESISTALCYPFCFDTSYYFMSIYR